MTKVIEANTAQGHTGGYIVGSTVTIADLQLFVLLGWLSKGVLDGIPKDIYEAYPTLKNLYEKLSENDKIAQFQAKHKK